MTAPPAATFDRGAKSMGTNTHTPNPWPSVGGLTLDTSDQVAKEQNWQEWRDGQHGYMCYVERISTSPGLPTQVSVRSLDPYPAYPAGYIFSFPPSDPALLPELARTQNYPHLQLSLTVDDGDQTNVKLLGVDVGCPMPTKATPTTLTG